MDTFAFTIALPPFSMEVYEFFTTSWLKLYHNVIRAFKSDKLEYKIYKRSLSNMDHVANFIELALGLEESQIELSRYLLKCLLRSFCVKLSVCA